MSDAMMADGPIFAPVFIAIRPNGQAMRVVSGGSVRECWNRLIGETGRSIAELKREGWRVQRDDGEPEVRA